MKVESQKIKQCVLEKFNFDKVFCFLGILILDGALVFQGVQVVYYSY